MNFKEITKLLTGFSTPIFGVSWNPPKPESDVAQRLINELEDRRVLYAPESVEIPSHCVDSIIEIRHILTGELHNVSPESNLASTIKAMRASCRKFLDTVQKDQRVIEFGAHPGHFANWHFNSAIGELRGVFGVHLAQVAAQYGISIDEPLSTILPIEAEET
ncbi:DUF6650 family protein [Methylohalobius crimeensis]|uniref:DUF6650 family protein n=1 Tax=Methylohalobius crimeensis TaxID=244365 RepID=UPI00126813E8|nr:DUF6650 family protein [Methylohalobius crimeensis]